jgi:hypothetical protein
MSVDLDRQLREYCRLIDEKQGVLSFDDILERAGEQQVIPNVISGRPDRQLSRRRKWIAVAAAALAFAIVAIGIRFLPATDGAPEPADQPTTTTWPGPVREDATSLGITTMERDVGDGTWSWEDPLDTPVDWIDVQRVSFLSEGQPHWYTELGAKPPLAAELEPGVLIAYGLVLDTGGDGIADYVIGIDNKAPQPGDFHIWVTDLASGEIDEQIGPPYGFPIEFSHPDETQPGDYPPGHPATMVFTFLGDSAPAGLGLGTTQFYVWTSTTTDGEVVSWDYAPDSSWLRVTASANAAAPEQTPRPSAPDVEPEARVLSIPVQNTSGQVAELFVARDTQPMEFLVGTVEPSTVGPGSTEDVDFTVPAGEDWAIFVNPGPDRGPLILASDIPPDASGELPIEIIVDQFGSPGVQTFGDPQPGWFGN